MSNHFTALTAELHQKKADYDTLIELFNSSVATTIPAKIKETFTTIFEENPDIVAIAWHQYTPFWQDGEECEFGINGPYVLTTAIDIKAKANEWEVENNGDYYHPDMIGEYWDSFKYVSLGSNKPNVNLMMEFKSWLYDMSDILEIVLGDHKCIVIDRNGCYVKQYDTHH